MKAGILKEKVSIYKPTVTRTQFGNVKTEWNYYCSTRSAVDYVNGNRSFDNHEVTYPVTRTFVLRFYVGIADEDRILWNNTYWKVLSIDVSKKYNNKVVTTEKVNE